jgi:hypothetical protein
LLLMVSCLGRGDISAVIAIKSPYFNVLRRASLKMSNLVVNLSLLRA